MTPLLDSNLRDTKPRRLILDVLKKQKACLLPQDIHACLRKTGERINLVTVYRVLEKFLAAGLVHRHPSTGAYLRCTEPDAKGHHGILSCSHCGKTEEFVSKDLSTIEHRIAESKGYRPRSHISEIIGDCSACLSSHHA